MASYPPFLIWLLNCSGLTGTPTKKCLKTVSKARRMNRVWGPAGLSMSQMHGRLSPSPLSPNVTSPAHHHPQGDGKPAMLLKCKASAQIFHRFEYLVRSNKVKCTGNHRQPTHGLHVQPCMGQAGDHSS